MDATKVSVLTLYDVSEVFDSVSHSILLNKCAKLNTDHFWCKSYMHKTSQSVRLNNTV